MKTLSYEPKSGAGRALCRQDEVLGALIRQVGEIQLVLDDDYFPALAESIVSQQLSLKAAQTIWNRMRLVCGTVSPEAILNTDMEKMRLAGLSAGKIVYLKDLSQKILDGEIKLPEFLQMPDVDIARKLAKVKGVGPWTVQMFLIFSLGREDVFSPKDAGLCRAVRWLYDNDTMTEEEIHALSKRWAPYRTCASLYLWEAINRGLVNS